MSYPSPLIQLQGYLSEHYDIYTTLENNTLLLETRDGDTCSIQYKNYFVIIRHCQNLKKPPPSTLDTFALSLCLHFIIVDTNDLELKIMGFMASHKNQKCTLQYIEHFLDVTSAFKKALDNTAYDATRHPPSYTASAKRSAFTDFTCVRT
ncbi:hypothetical protein [Pseudomonas sp.]|uniref:hypothetical protein n=1 Tax=Pseudomonas sp. TaxID=306 RepID=UPI002627B4CC|nr:hypothetical protein [Pseudomonas sp.]